LKREGRNPVVTSYTHVLLKVDSLAYDVSGQARRTLALAKLVD